MKRNVPAFVFIGKGTVVVCFLSWTNDADHFAPILKRSSKKRKPDRSKMSAKVLARLSAGHERRYGVVLHMCHACTVLPRVSLLCVHD